MLNHAPINFFSSLFSTKNHVYFSLSLPNLHQTPAFVFVIFYFFSQSKNKSLCVSEWPLWLVTAMGHSRLYIISLKHQLPIFNIIK